MFGNSFCNRHPVKSVVPKDNTVGAMGGFDRTAAVLSVVWIVIALAVLRLE